MRTRHLKALLALSLLVPATAAAVVNGLTVQPQSRLWIDGTSTVRSFTCKASTFEAKIATRSPEAVGLVLSGEKAVSSVRVSVPAGNLDCGNGTMNSHMHKAIRADQHPAITFELSSYDLAKAGEGQAVRMTGKLSLGGTEKAVTLQATAEPAANGMLRVSGVQPILLSDYGLKAPTLMMGTMKVGDEVKVGYELLLRP